MVKNEERRTQEIYRPGTAISDASNLCTAVGGDQNKEFRGNASFERGGGGEYEYIAIVGMNTMLLNIVWITNLKAGDGNDINQDCIQNVRQYFKKLFKYKSKGKLHKNRKGFSSLVTNNFKIYLRRLNRQKGIQINLVHKLLCKKTTSVYLNLVTLYIEKDMFDSQQYL